MMKKLIKELLRENLMLEGEVLPYKKTQETNTFIEYSFTTYGLQYVVTFITDDQHQSYILGFGVIGEESNHRTGKDVRHLNTILQTVDNIVGDAVKQYRIKQIIFSGARGQTDSNIPFIDPIRNKVYLRYLMQHHPNAKIDKDRMGNISVFMNSIYPEIFQENKDIKEMFLDIISAISDENPNDWRFDSNYQLENGYLTGESDAIENSKLGSMLIGVDYDDGYKTYDLTVELFDNGQEYKEEFKNFDKLLIFLKQFISKG